MLCQKLIKFWKQESMENKAKIQLMLLKVTVAFIELQNPDSEEKCMNNDFQ